MNRALRAPLIVLSLLLAGCGDSGEVQPPPPSTTISDAISEADAVAKAEAAATDRGFELQGLEVKPAQLFGEWQVSFEPPDTDSLSGGFLVILEAETGELVDLVEYQ